MRMKVYRVDLPPIPWQRPKLNGHRFYDGQVSDKVAFGLHLLRQHGQDDPFSNPISINITFFMRIAPGTRVGALTRHHKNKPELDSLLKFSLDALVDADILSDDRIICMINAKKEYSLNPRTEFTIKEVE